MRTPDAVPETGDDIPEVRGGQWGRANLQVNLFGRPDPDPERDDRGPVFAVPRLSGWEVARPDTSDHLRRAVLDSEGNVALTTAVLGGGGFGKSTLARMLVHEPEIRDRFRDGVVWVTLGERLTGPELAERVNQVTWQLTGVKPPLTDPEQAGGELGRCLGDRRVLVVVDDVWSREQVEAFLYGGSRAVRLITTRVRSTVDGRADLVDVDVMARDQARHLLLSGVDLAPGRGTDKQAVRARCEQLLTATGCWPVLLGLVNAAVRAHVRAGAGVEQSLAGMLEYLAEEGPTALDLEDAQRRDEAVGATVEASLRCLSGEERARYLELAVFAEDTDVPWSLLARYWRTSAEWSTARTYRFCRRLADLSLVTDHQEAAADNAGPSLRLHDVVRDYLRHAAKDDLPRLNTMLVDAHRALVPATGPGCGQGSRWWRLPSAETYLWAHLASHLKEAGRDDEVRRVVTHPEFVVGVLEHVGPSGLQADLALSDDETATTLHRLVARRGYLLGKLDPPGALRSTLLSLIRPQLVLAGFARELDLRGTPGAVRVGPGTGSVASPGLVPVPRPVREAVRPCRCGQGPRHGTGRILACYRRQ